MECKLSLPSLDLVFSSKRSDSELQEQEHKYHHQQPGARGFSFDKSEGAEGGSSLHRDPSGAGNYVYGGLSVTGRLYF